MQRTASYLIGAMVLLAGLSACGDDSGGGTGGDTGTTSTSTSASGSTGSSTSGSPTSSSGGEGGDGTGAGPVGSGGGGTGGDTGTGGAAGTGGATGTGGAGGGAGCDGVELTVKNYLSWCDVTVAGEAPFSGPQQTVCVPEGETALSATALEGFILGDNMWHHTDGDAGDGEPGDVNGDVSSATVTVSGSAACVWVCCPFPDGSGCDVSDQCP